MCINFKPKIHIYLSLVALRKVSELPPHHSRILISELLGNPRFNPRRIKLSAGTVSQANKPIKLSCILSNHLPTLDKIQLVHILSYLLFHLSLLCKMNQYKDVICFTSLLTHWYILLVCSSICFLINSYPLKGHAVQE